MSKRRKFKRAPSQEAATAPEAAPATRPATGKVEVRAREENPHHHGNHRGLLTHVAGVKPRESGSPTAFDKVELYDKARKGGYLHLYIAASSMVAVTFGPESDFRCWNYAAYTITDERAALSALDGKHPEHVETSTKRNAMHVRLGSSADMGLIADLGAAAAFVHMQVDIGEPTLPAVSYVGATKAQNGQNLIRARLFAPTQGDSPVALATTHLREDTTSMTAFHASNTDMVASMLGRGDMTPGGACHTLPEFIDLSMFRAEQSSEAYIGQLLARSLCQLAPE